MAEKKSDPSPDTSEKATVTCPKCKTKIEIEPPEVKRPPVKKGFFSKLWGLDIPGYELYFCHSCGTKIMVDPEDLYMTKRMGIDPKRTALVRCPKCRTLIRVEKEEADAHGGRMEIKCSGCGARLLFKSSGFFR